MKPPELAGFDRDLKAAVLAGVPIEIGSADSVTAPVLLTPAMMKSMPHQPDASLPKRFAIARDVYQRVGVSEPILEALTARVSATSEAVRVIRWPMIYVTLITFVAMLGLAFFATQVTPLIADVRADLALGANLNKPHYPLTPPWIQPVALAVAVVLAALLLLILLGGTRWLALMFGGTAFVRSRVIAAAVRVSSLLQRVGVDRESAIQLSFDLAGADQATRASLGKAMNSIAVPGCQLLTNEREASDYFLVSGNRRLARMQAMAPAGLVLLLGGSVAVAYGVAVFLPVIQLLHDLHRTGV